MRQSLTGLGQAPSSIVSTNLAWRTNLSDFAGTNINSVNRRMVKKRGDIMDSEDKTLLALLLHQTMINVLVSPDKSAIRPGTLVNRFRPYHQSANRTFW
jgi:hypothetical protein